MEAIRKQQAEDVSTHSRAEAAAERMVERPFLGEVSTHSRAEAAASILYSLNLRITRFNTQPRGGGCRKLI